MIEILNLSKQFGDEVVLKEITETVRSGEVVSVIGPSGSGKSTLLRCINLLEQPNQGTIRISGDDILAPHADIPRIRQKTGMVFQSFNLFHHMTVLENLTVGPIRILKHPRLEAEKRAHELLKMVGLSGKADSLPDELSGGQKQRVAIARCLSMNPEIILFDEPTSALDPTMISEVLAVIRRLANDGMTMMIVTHELDFARDVSDRVFYMDEGVIYESGPASEIMDAPSREKTCAFINRLRSFSYEIESPDYDVYAMNAEIDLFCEKHFFSRKMTQFTHLAVEETLTYYFAHDEHQSVTLTLSFAEKEGSLTLLFDDPNPSGNFLDEAEKKDELGLTVLRGIVHDITWERQQSQNRVSMTLNEINS
jgi:polar amino acid transport system ATP-binding protein